MTVTRIKLCGIRCVEDARFAEQLGVDAIGLVFHPASPRHVTLEEAGRIVAALGGMMTVVALFHNADENKVWPVLEAMPQLMPQFHGHESADFCEQFGRPYLKAFGMGQGGIEPERIREYENASAVLLDANAQGDMGGTGHTFDWSKIPEGLEKPLILAGGLDPQNVAIAIREVHPFAVDVSSGIESARGIKNHALMQEFVTNARGADSETN